MSEDILRNYFDIHPETSRRIGDQMYYLVEGSVYSTVQVTQWQEEALLELYEMSEHMAKIGDKKVSTFVPANDQKFLITLNEQDYVVLHNHYVNSSNRKNRGRQLARFHERGRYLQSPITQLNREGQWKEFWIQRLEQMEKVWSGLVREPSEERFNQLFVESFPYYLGICENAIQYVKDTELDESFGQSDQRTICHQSFGESTWDSSQIAIRNPFDWVVDHRARDIAEWIRECYFLHQRSYKPLITKFLQGYQSIAPLSKFSWRMIYGRLLFPLPYFLSVENYFLSPSEASKKQLEEKLDRYIRNAQEYEVFLREFFHLANQQTGEMPPIEWLNI
ncbi:spore coat protein YutH [Lederbergia galactosidilyticus]|uniref:spore coat putative kinase YutH n=1 Tax=Lederbergia galactosidilytica TaxID=217031 RepID=UPI001AE4F699|nr:spore coat protein YutH [Lederbergia galactosidilytica]MBP1913139.1 spore coat protein YutH [Lederbergia galactosidilytica]